jgi:multiple sugar transport system ATP-binding protein
MPAVILKNLSKKFGENEVIKKIDLKIIDKEFFVIVGPSGCGKTTLLRMIAGLETITEGDIYIDDERVNDIPPKDRNVAMVFQNYCLYPHMNVYNNLAFGLKIRNVPKTIIDQKVRNTATILGIANLLSRKPKELSGGEQQRVALGKAIIKNSKLLLLDEPLSNLDAKFRISMRSELLKLHRKLNSTIIYVTHDQIEAMTMGDRIAVMNKGEIKQVGTPLEIYNYPKNKFVAGFFGTPPMNFFEGKLILKNSKLFIDIGEFLLKFPLRLFNNYKKILNKKIILGCRPENILILKKTPDTERFEKITAKVEFYEPLGSEVILELSTQLHSFKAKVKPDMEIKINAYISLYIDMQKVYLFDEETGEAIY